MGLLKNLLLALASFVLNKLGGSTPGKTWKIECNLCHEIVFEATSEPKPGTVAICAECEPR